MENPVGHPTCREAHRWFRDPSLPVPHSEITAFPHAVLEIKLSLLDGEEAPAWVADLAQNRALLHEVDKFSKFGHGCAALLHANAPCLPYWIDDTSIRSSLMRSQVKPPRAGGGGGGGGVGVSSRQLGGGGGEGLSRGGSFMAAAEEESKAASLRAPLLGGASPAPGAFTGVRARRQPSEDPNFVPGLGEMRAGQQHQMINLADPAADRPNSWVESIPAGSARARGRGADDEHPVCCDAVLRCFSGGKKAGVPRKMPMKIEPKTFFANERTFLAWLHTAVTLGGIGAAILALAPVSATDDDTGTNASGMTLAMVGILVTLYAMRVFQWRSKMIKERKDGPYHVSARATRRSLPTPTCGLLPLLLAWDRP